MIQCPEFCKGGCLFLSLGVHVECFGSNLTHQKVSMLVSSWFLKFSSLLVWRIQNSPKTWFLPMSMFNLWLMFQPCFPGSRFVCYHFQTWIQGLARMSIFQIMNPPKKLTYPFPSRHFFESMTFHFNPFWWVPCFLRSQLSGMTQETPGEVRDVQPASLPGVFFLGHR